MAVCVTGLFGAKRVKLPGFVAAPVVVFVVLVLLAGVVSLLSSTTEYAVRGTYGLLAILGAAFTTAGYCIPRGGVVSRTRQRVMTGTLVLLSAVIASWALRQSMVGFSDAEIEVIKLQESTRYVGNQIRSIGTFSISQEFGAFAAAATPWLAVLAVRAGRRLRWVLWAVFILLVAALLTSLARTAIVAALIASLVGIVRNAPGRHVVTKAIAGLTIVILALGAGVAVMTSSSDPRVVDALARIETLQNISEDDSFSARTNEVWWRGIDLMVDHPFGLGAGAAGPASSRFPDAAPAGAVVVDNGYIMVGVQLGWIGMFVFAWMLIAILIWLGRSPSTFARAGSSAALALIIAMVALQYWALSAPALLVGSIIGLGMSDATRRSAADTTPVGG
jgi:hypothetical protein